MSLQAFRNALQNIFLTAGNLTTKGVDTVKGLDLRVCLASLLGLLLLEFPAASSGFLSLRL